MRWLVHLVVVKAKLYHLSQHLLGSILFRLLVKLMGCPNLFHIKLGQLIHLDRVQMVFCQPQWFTSMKIAMADHQWFGCSCINLTVWIELPTVSVNYFCSIQTHIISAAYLPKLMDHWVLLLPRLNFVSLQSSHHSQYLPLLAKVVILLQRLPQNLLLPPPQTQPIALELNLQELTQLQHYFLQVWVSHWLTVCCLR